MAPLLVRRTPTFPLHVGAESRGLKRDSSERGIQGFEVWAWVGAERTGLMVERARQRERTDLSVPDAKYEGDITSNECGGTLTSKESKNERRAKNERLDVLER